MSWWKFWKRGKLELVPLPESPAASEPPENEAVPLADPSGVPAPRPAHESPKKRLCCTCVEGVVACAKCGDKAAFCGFKGDIYRQVEFRRAPDKEVETRTDFSAGHGCEMCGAFAHEKVGAPPQYGLDALVEDVPCAAAREVVCPRCQKPNVIPCGKFFTTSGVSPTCFKCNAQLIGENAVVRADEDLLTALKQVEKAVKQDLAARGELRDSMFNRDELE